MSDTHHLKIWPPYFRAVRDGLKTFEVRKNDRNFQPGDALVLKEWDPAAGRYTGHKCNVIVTYVLAGDPLQSFGIADGYVVMGIAHD